MDKNAHLGVTNVLGRFLQRERNLVVAILQNNFKIDIKHHRDILVVGNYLHHRIPRPQKP